MAPGAEVIKGDLYEQYKAWCQETGEREITQSMLTRRLKERGFGERRDMKARFYTSLGLATDAYQTALVDNETAK